MSPYNTHNESDDFTKKLFVKPGWSYIGDIISSLILIPKNSNALKFLSFKKINMKLAI